METVIRPCTINDLDELLNIGKETFYDTFHEQNTAENMTAYMEKAFTEEKLTRELNDKTAYFYFVELDGNVAGYLKVNVGESQTEPMSDEYLEVERIYVRKQYQKSGIGKVMMVQAEQKAIDLGKSKIWLGVWEKNTNAIEFYKRKGFKHTGEHHFHMGDEAQTDYVMEK